MSDIPGIVHDLALVLQCAAVVPMQNWIALNHPIPIHIENEEVKRTTS